MSLSFNVFIKFITEFQNNMRISEHERFIAVFCSDQNSVIALKLSCLTLIASLNWRKILSPRLETDCLYGK